MHQRRIKFEPIGGGGGIKSHIFDEIIGLENLFLAWREFKKGKSKKSDVQEFEFNLEDNLFQLHQELKTKTYQHSHYTAFNVCDPKPRRIHKACVRDRVLHHALFRILYPLFDKGFIFDSYSCRLGKGTHRAVNRLEKFTRKLSKNNRQNIFALKCDIRRFFDSVDQNILLGLIRKKVQDDDAVWLLLKIIKSFEKSPHRGLPLGNVTSQLFANIYLNEIDQFVKHKLRIKYYLRYCDDFVILDKNVFYPSSRTCFGISLRTENDIWERTSNNLTSLIGSISCFLKEKLKLTLHSDKIIIRKYGQGIDWLGYVVLPHYRVLRTKTKKRMFRKIKESKAKLNQDLVSRESFNQSLQSYHGVLKHCNSYKLKRELDKFIKSL